MPVFLKQRENGKITVTDPRMSRFWITLAQGVRFVVQCVEQMHGGEIFIPKIPSMNTIDLAKTVAPQSEVEIIGIRPGEKMHEVLISEDEGRHTVEFDDRYVIRPAHPWWNGDNWTAGKELEDGFSFRSDTNSRWLTRVELEALIEEGSEL